MTETTKIPAEYDYQQMIRRMYNSDSATMGVDGFLAGAIGRKIIQTKTTTTVPNDTLVFTFVEGGLTIQQLTLVFVDSTHEEMISAERTA